MRKVFNYQKFDFVKYNGKICEVRGTLDSFGLNLADKDGNFYEDIYAGDVEPIEITVELLEKIGYKYFDLGNSYCYHDEFHFTSDYYIDSPDKKFTIHSRHFDAIKTNVYYIHEMQQLFRLGDFEFLIYWDLFNEQ